MDEPQGSTLCYHSYHDQTQLYFYDLLRPSLIVGHLFGQTLLPASHTSNVLAKCLFALVWLFSFVVFILAFSGQDDTTDLWIRVPQYIIPVVTLPCGMKALNSKSYYRLLQRRTTKAFMVGFFTSQNLCAENSFSAAAHNEKWIKGIALKSVFLPFILCVIPILGVGITCWEGGTIIDVIEGSKVNVDLKKWAVAYFIFWFLTFYCLGFVTFQFVFMSRLIAKDTFGVMSLFGDSCFLRTSPIHYKSFKTSYIRKCIRRIINFATMDLWSSSKDDFVYTNSIYISRKQTDYVGSSFSDIIPKRLFQKQTVGSDLSNSDMQQHSCDTKEEISPNEALQVIATFISEIEELTSSFSPFTVLVLLFGVTNMISHICLYAVHDVKHISTVVLFRTILYLLVTLRLLLCIHQISSTLVKLPAHIKLMILSGRFEEDVDNYPSWNEVLDFIDSFKIEKRSFGFPLGLIEVGSIATCLNTLFLIIISVSDANKIQTTANNKTSSLFHGFN